MHTDATSKVAPDGLSDEAGELWAERMAEFAKLGTVRAPLRDLVDGWARAWDAQRAAEAAWDSAGRPESEEGSMGQERRHHLAVARERADRHLDALSSRLERAGFRRPPRPQGVPDGARVLRRLVSGGKVILDRDGRVRHQGVLDAAEWCLTWQELMYDHGRVIRWVGEDGLPVVCDPPPLRVNGRLDRDEVLEWARLRDVPEAAAIEWYEHPSRRIRLTCRDDVDVVRHGLEGFRVRAA